MLVHSCMQIKIIQFKKIIMFDDSLKDENKFYCFNRLLVPEDSNMEKTIFDNKKTIFNSTKRLICVGFENNEDIFERGEKLKAIEVLENSLFNNTTEKRRITRRASQIEIFNKQLKERLSKIQNIPLLQERLSKFSTKNSIFQKNKKICILHTDGKDKQNLNKSKSTNDVLIPSKKIKEKGKLKLAILTSPKADNNCSLVNLCSSPSNKYFNSKTYTTSTNNTKIKNLKYSSTFHSPITKGSSNRTFLKKLTEKTPKNQNLQHNSNVFLTTTNSVLHSKSEKVFKIPKINMKKIKKTVYETLINSKNIEKLSPYLKSSPHSHEENERLQALDRNSLIPLLKSDRREKEKNNKKNKVFIKNKSNGQYTLIDQGHANLINFCDNYLLFNDVDFFKRGKTILSKYPLIQKRADIKFDLGEIEIEPTRYSKLKKNDWKMKKLAQQIVNINANINYTVDNFNLNSK